MVMLSQNLRYLLWKKEIPRSRWINQLSEWLSCEICRVKAILQGAPLTEAECEELRQSSDLDPDFADDDLMSSIHYRDWLKEKQVSIIHENIRFLVQQWKESGQKRTNLASKVEVNDSTVSRWLEEKRKPQGKQKEKLHQVFGLPSGINLENDPLFLSLEPVGTLEQRNWLHEHIDSIDNKTLRDFFPALKKLLDEP